MKTRMLPASLLPACRRQVGGGQRAALALLLSVPSLIAQTNYEAELALLSHGAQAENCSYASGGKVVKHIGGDNGGAVAFTVVRTNGGLYPMTVQYDVSDDRSFRIRINGEMTYDLSFPRTASRGTISSQTLLAPLRAGTNTIGFSNDNEFGPELDRLAIADAPAESAAICGKVEGAHGGPLAGVEMRLMGELEGRAFTDAQGRFEFPFLPEGDYYVRPVKPGVLFGPVERYSSAHYPATNRLEFRAREFSAQAARKSLLQAGKWRLEYELGSGLADLYFDGKLVIARAFALARLPDPVSSLDYRTRKLRRQPLQDGFGHGTEFLVESANHATDTMTQRFRLYDDTDFILADVEVSRAPVAISRYLAPLVTQTPVRYLPGGDNRALFVPFDNDKWIRYDAFPFGGEVTSYEVSALYNNDHRLGLVAGSIEHDTWKTGVRINTTRDSLSGLEIFGGIASPKTRDVLPHGRVSGASIRSPRILVGCFSDWRAGLEAYARANAVVAPARSWSQGVPFGWNSWGKLQGRLTFDKAMQVSDFFARELQPHHFDNHGTVYLGLDSGWNRFTDEQLKRFVEHCRANGQQAGRYFTPFAGCGRRRTQWSKAAAIDTRTSICMRAVGRNRSMAASRWIRRIRAPASASSFWSTASSGRASLTSRRIS